MLRLESSGFIRGPCVIALCFSRSRDGRFLGREKKSKVVNWAIKKICASFLLLCHY